MTERKQVSDLDLLFQFTATMRATDDLLKAVAAVGNLARRKHRPICLVVPPIVCTVAQHCNVQLDKILGGGRQQPLVDARHIAMWLLREGGLSYQKIALSMNVEAHMTVMNACARVERNQALMAIALEIRVKVERERAELAATVTRKEAA